MKTRMRRTWIVAAVVTSTLLMGEIALHQTTSKPPPVTPPPVPAPVALSAAAPAVVAQPIAPLAQPVDLADMPAPGDVTDVLKGRDFTFRVVVNGNDQYRNLDIVMADGTPIELLRSLDGQTGDMGHTTFFRADRLALVDLLPGAAREQIIYEDSTWLPRGEGALATWTLYRIEGDHLEELFRVITDRDREEADGLTGQKLTARVEQTTRDGRPAFLYHVRTGKEPERTIAFIWNGKRFEDASGEYAKIAEQNNP
jgi:hypothetical protein